MKRGEYSRALLEIKCAFKGEPMPKPIIVPSTNNYDNDYDYDNQAPEISTKVTIPKPSRPPKNTENEVVLVYMPTAKVLGINIDYKKPKRFENAAAKQLWLDNARKEANLLKEKLLSGQVDARRLPAGQIIVDPSPRATATAQQQEVDLMRELHEREDKLFTERDFIEICGQIRECLGTRQANVGKCLKLLDLFKEIELDKLMLLRNPESVDTIRGLTKYVGNLKVWQMAPSDEAEFNSLALVVRQKSKTIYEGFQKLFNFAVGADFYLEFWREVTTYRTHTDHLNANLRVLMNERSYRKLVRDKQGQPSVKTESINKKHKYQQDNIEY
ncbi:uncharacterized protein LOC111067053 [Drosophila obscura]|uniref:uncharacterized protein LOC111067053 n=1 Tax=Drosophila obscura TaxID=7282 RepID=UPI001BB1602F|nr:uncharacterized protein LOC111067053 [Drosophila obscura]